MAIISIDNLELEEVLDSADMEQVQGGYDARRQEQSELGGPKDRDFLNLGNSIVIIGEEKYGGWGGEW